MAVDHVEGSCSDIDAFTFGCDGSGDKLCVGLHLQALLFGGHPLQDYQSCVICPVSS